MRRRQPAVGHGAQPSAHCLALTHKWTAGSLQQHTTLLPSMCSLTCCPPHLPAAHLQALLDRIPDELALLFSNRSWRSRGIRPQASKAPAPCHLSLPIPPRVCSRWLAAASRCYSHNVHSPCLHRHCHSLLHLQTMSNLTWAYAKLDRKPLLLTQDLLKESLPLLPQFKPQVGRAGQGKWGGGRWQGSGQAYSRGRQQQEWWTALSCFQDPDSRPRLLPSSLHSQELANLMWAIAKMDYYPGASMVDALTQVGGQACCGSEREFGSEERGTATVPARPGQARLVKSNCSHSLLPACLPACLPARLPACLPARPPACLPARRPAALLVTS
jgi:hypothetical protein